MDSFFKFKEPMTLTNEALRVGWPLLLQWKKPGRPRRRRRIGFGWHELITNEYAGFHASCYGLKLIANENFPVNRDERQALVREVAKLVKHTIEFSVNKATRRERDHYLEAQNSTVKVAN